MSALLVAGWLAAGCGAATRETVEATVDELAKPATWQKLQGPARAITAAVVGGVVDGMAAGVPRREAIDAAIEHYVGELSRAAAAALDQQWTPALERSVRAMVRGVIDEALAAPTRDAAATLTSRIVMSALDAIAAETRLRIGPAMRAVLESDLGPGFSTVLTHDLGPALQTVLAKNLGPGLRSIIDEVTPSVAHLAETASAATVHAVADGAEASFHRIVDPRLARLEELAARGERDAISLGNAILAGVLVGLVIVLGGLAAWHWRRGKDHRLALDQISNELDRLSVDPAHADVARNLNRLVSSGVRRRRSE
jgi:hypothetical protein